MAKEERRTWFQVWLDRLLIYATLKVIRCKEHDDVSLFDCISNARNAKTLCLSLCLRLGARLKANANIHSAIAQA